MREYEILFLEEFVDWINLKEEFLFIICSRYNFENLDMYCKICDLLICKDCRIIFDYVGYEVFFL